MTAGLALRIAVAPAARRSTACRNLITLFFRHEKSDVNCPRSCRRRHSSAVQRVGVVGAGAMGAGIAQLAAFKGCKVVVREVSQAALDAGFM